MPENNSDPMRLLYELTIKDYLKAQRAMSVLRGTLIGLLDSRELLECHKRSINAAILEAHRIEGER